MICHSCKSEIENNSSICPKCGVSQVEKKPTALDALKPKLVAFFSKRNNLIASGGVVVLLIALFVVFSPKTVTVNLEIKATNGGVFTQDCKITSYAEYLINDKFEAVSKSDKKDVKKAKIEWFADRGKCLGVAKVTVSPFESYDLYAGSSLVGSIKDGKAWSGKVDGLATLAVKHNMTVSMDLVVTADTCSGDASASWSCRGFYGLTTDSDAGTCNGIGGYNDIKSGAKIVITGKSSKKTFQGELDTGRDWSLDSTSSRKIDCTLLGKNAIEVDHDDAGYFVNIEDRGDVYYSNDDLASASWNAAVHLGD